MFRALSWLAGFFGRRVRPPKATPPDAEGARAAELIRKRFGYTFRRPGLLARALTHPSAAVRSRVHYERLEFLGDAVLDLAVADLLMKKFPDAQEGELSKQRASVVNGRTLAATARSIGLGAMLRLGKGEEKTGGRDKPSILAATFEALIGAIYIDGGLVDAQRIVEEIFADEFGGPTAERDYKTELQEVAYRRFHAQPVYELIASRGPDHARHFTTRIRIAGRQLGTGEGGSKKRSEQEAARRALGVIEHERGQ